jgi:hypothetical protein
LGLTYVGPATDWQLLAIMCVTIGALIFGAAILWASGAKGSKDVFQASPLFAVFAFFSFTAVVAKSSLMAVLSTLVLAMWLGSSAFHHGARIGCVLCEEECTYRCEWCLNNLSPLLPLHFMQENPMFWSWRSQR